MKVQLNLDMCTYQSYLLLLIFNKIKTIILFIFLIFEITNKKTTAKVKILLFSLKEI